MKYSGAILLSFVVLFLLLLFTSSAHAQWFHVNGGGVVVLSSEPNAMPPGRRDFAMWCDKDDLYVSGGVGAGGQALRDLWKFETESNRWLWLADPPVSTTSGATWSFGGTLWLYDRHELWAYKLDERVWSQRTGPPAGVDTDTAVTWLHLPTSTAYLFGTANQTGTPILQAFNLEAESWQVVTTGGVSPPSLNVASGAAALGSNQDTVYMFSDSLFTYDIPSAMWAKSNFSYTSAREDTALWLGEKLQHLVLFGGRIGSEVIADQIIFHLEEDERSVEQTASGSGGGGPSERYGMRTCTNDQSITYLFAGGQSDPDNMLNDVWKYGSLSRQNWLDLLDFKLNSTSVFSLIAALFSILTFLLFAVVLTIIGVRRCYLRWQKKKQGRRILPWKDSMASTHSGEMEQGHEFNELSLH